MELIEGFENLEISLDGPENYNECENKILSKNQQKKLNRYEAILGQIYLIISIIFSYLFESGG